MQEIPRISKLGEMITGLIKEGLLKGCDLLIYRKLVTVQIAGDDPLSISFKCSRDWRNCMPCCN